MRTLAHRTSLAAVAALAAAILLAGLVPGGSAFAAYPGANGKIAYERDDGVDSEIFVMNANGSGQTNLINDPAPPNHADDRDPAWSPDGTKIAFMRSGGVAAPQGEGHQNIHVMNADGTGLVNLTPGPDITGAANAGVEPTWSPDGTHIAYNHSGDIWVMSASGGSKVKLEFGSGLETWPAWSPDGTKIAFIRGFDVWVGPATGGVPTQLTTGAGSDKGPDWSPDGSKIVYERSGHIWSMSSNGSGQTDHTTGLNETGTLPAWAPDGSKIVFDSNGFTAPNGYDIFVMDANGTNETRIDTGPDTDLDPSWQPIAVPGGYPRPVSASPVQVALVPAYRQCTAANRTHGPPLEHPSCNPPTPESSQLTVGTFDANGQNPNSKGFAKYAAIVGVPGGADDSDVRLTFQLTDVRHQGTLTDYTGELQAATVVRITDKVGGPAGEAATVDDLQFAVTFNCAAVSGAPGATCGGTTTLDAVAPGAIPEGKRSVWELQQVRVNDGGADGVVNTTPNTLFAVQGIFVP